MKNLTGALRIGGVSLFLVAGASEALGAVTGDSVFLQAPATSPNSRGGTSSYFTPGSTFQRHIADGVILGQSATISSLRFWGFNGGTEPVASTRFRVSLWRGDGVSTNGLASAPGTRIFEQEFALSDPRMETFVIGEPLTAITRYEINLGSASTLSLQGGQRYWLAIAGSTEQGQGTLDQWAWGDAPVGSGFGAVYNVFSSNSWFSFEPLPGGGPQGGRAFELFAIPGPGPVGALGLLGLLHSRRAGCAGIGARRR